MAGLFSFGKRSFAERRYLVIIEVRYVGGRLADDLIQMLTAEVSVPDAAHPDVVVAVTPERASVLVVSAVVDAANPRATLSQLDEALDRALITTGLFEEFDVTGKVLRVAPQQHAERLGSQPGGGAGPAVRRDRVT